MIALWMACTLDLHSGDPKKSFAAYLSDDFAASAAPPVRDTIGSARLAAVGWDPLLYRERGALRSDVLSWSEGPSGTTLELHDGLGSPWHSVEAFSSSDVCHSVAAPCEALVDRRARV